MILYKLDNYLTNRCEALPVLRHIFERNALHFRDRFGVLNFAFVTPLTFLKYMFHFPHTLVLSFDFPDVYSMIMLAEQ